MAAERPVGNPRAGRAGSGCVRAPRRDPAACHEVSCDVMRRARPPWRCVPMCHGMSCSACAGNMPCSPSGHNAPFVTRSFRLRAGVAAWPLSAAPDGGAAACPGPDPGTSRGLHATLPLLHEAPDRIPFVTPAPEPYRIHTSPSGGVALHVPLCRPGPRAGAQPRFSQRHQRLNLLSTGCGIVASHGWTPARGPG